MRRVTLAAFALLALGCRTGGTGRARPEGGRRDLVASTSTTVELYRRAGFVAEASPVPFVGSIRYLAGARDTTVVLLSLSMPARALTFIREGDRYRATYAVIADLRQAGATIRHIEAQEHVRVSAFKETTRADESIVFQQMLNVPPGPYVLTLSIRDDAGSKTSVHEELLTVPRLAAGRLSSPIAVYAVSPRSSEDSLPVLTASPRATAYFGRDSVLNVYVEGYGEGTETSLGIRAGVTTPQGIEIWSAAGQLPRRGELFSGTLAIPADRLGIGNGMLRVMRDDGRDTVTTPLVVTFSDDIAVHSFEEMIAYLRYFTAPHRLQVLREAPPERRAALWAQFLAETDPNTATPEHEGIREYFERVQIANERFRDEGGLGWLSDRGMVFITLGEPDQILEQTSSEIGQRGRLQAWEYRQHHAQLIFVDQTGFGRWRLTTGSEADFHALVQRLRAR